MLPTSDLTIKKKPSKPLSPNTTKALVQSLQSYYASARTRSCLVLSVLLLQFLLLLSVLFSSLRRQPTLPISSSSSGTVYVYDLPPMFNSDLINDCDSLNPWNSRCDALSNSGFGRRLRPSWYATDQFAAELIFHRRILHHRCRTSDPSSASAFYIPFYAGLAVGKYLWSSNHTSRDRDFHCEKLLRWVSHQEPYRRSDGWDHFIMLGRITWDFRRSRSGNSDWGSSFLYMPGMSNVTRLLIERNPWDPFDVGVPYPTGFHPRSESDIREWQAHILSKRRSTLFAFAGATRSTIKNDFRGVLLRQCEAAEGRCRAVDCGGKRCTKSGAAAAVELFLDSEFCLQPRGDSFTRRSMFDCMIAGAVPVFFWRRTAYTQYEWFLPGEGESWSVFIDRREVKNGTRSVREVLEGLGEERVRKMRERVVELLPRLVYAEPEMGLGGVGDAFDVAVEGVLKRFRRRRLQRQEEEEGKEEQEE
ncbi:hypothetical protein QJS04_geneDACA020644 [Acorus gramineus]|uniref:Exostosin GT47 domain-containing protein n=1 Tax=Acorus gramineus TaxID=55184 RepID=A0AAV9BDU8_ACOGR|nr:hypothetical protein QJS04_geneDACA020644 [Acorus gramineus]